MANPEHVEKLKQGVAVWNQWREENPDAIPDIRGENLGGAHLTYTKYWPADLPKSARKEPLFEKPILKGINLRRAKIDETYFGQADLERANFRGAEGQRADFRESKLRNVDFSHAGLIEANFYEADLQEAKFEGYANFSSSIFTCANLYKAKLKNATFGDSWLAHTDLRYADLSSS